MRFTPVRFADLDAVTLDAHGTLLRVADPVPALDQALRRHGVERDRGAIAAAFAAEAAYYTGRSLEGRDDASLADLRRRCAAVFLEALGADLAPDEFALDFVSALDFEVLPGVVGALTSLTRRGLSLAVVSNWDHTLPDHLARLGLGPFMTAVVTSAAAGSAKPGPAIFRLALARLGVETARAVHVGDGPADEQGAAAAGLRFVPAPLASAASAWS